MPNLKIYHVISDLQISLIKCILILVNKVNQTKNQIDKLLLVLLYLIGACWWLAVLPWLKWLCPHTVRHLVDADCSQKRLRYVCSCYCCCRGIPLACCINCSYWCLLTISCPSLVVVAVSSYSETFGWCWLPSKKTALRLFVLLLL